MRGNPWVKHAGKGKISLTLNPSPHRRGGLPQGLFIVTLSGSEGCKVLSVPTILVPEDFRFFSFGSE